MNRLPRPEIKTGMKINKLTVKEVRNKIAVCKCNCGTFPVNRSIITLQMNFNKIAKGECIHMSCSKCKRKNRNKNHRDFELRSGALEP